MQLFQGARNILSGVANIFNKAPKGVIPDVRPPAGSTAKSNGDISTTIQAAAKYWGVSPERLAVWYDIENMDANDEVVSQALDTIADTATGLEDNTTEAFCVKSNNPKVLEILNDCADRLLLKEKAWDITRKMAKHGNEFREIVISPIAGQLKITGLLEDLPCYQIMRNKDGNNKVIPSKPWIQKSLGPLGNGNTIEFAPWQLAHFSYGDMRDGIATPKLKSARRNWKRLQLTEDTMAHARMIRGYSKHIHRVPIEESATPDEIRKALIDYKDMITKKEFLNWSTGQKDALDNPLSVDTDFYLPDDGSGRGGITSLDPQNANLQNIDDVIYSLNRILCRLGVPRRYLNLEGMNTTGLAQGDSAQEEKHFARRIRAIQGAFKRGVTFIFNLELLLHGINPLEADNAYKIEMVNVNSDDLLTYANAQLMLANAATTWVKLMDLPEELLLEKFMELTEYEREQYAESIKLRPWPNPALVGGDPMKSDTVPPSDSKSKPINIKKVQPK